MTVEEPGDVDKLDFDLHSAFECKSKGMLKEYVGSRINIVRKRKGLATVKFTQPVLVQKLEDEYNLPSRKANTPAVAG